MGRFAPSMVVVFLLALVLETSPAKAIDCMSAVSNVLPCSNFLKNPNNALPEPTCCNAAGNWIGLGDVDSISVCKCLQPITSLFLSHKAQQLPGLCNLDPAAYLPLAICLAPPDDATDGLPRPLPFVPPAENQEKDLQDGLLPPLPLVPLPPLPPLIPLPPLPPLIPLPPLPLVPPAAHLEEQNKNVATGDNLGADGLLPPLPLVPTQPKPLIPLPPLPFVPPAEKHD